MKEHSYEKCCFFIPLTVCLGTWGAIKIVMDITFLILCTMIVIIFLMYSDLEFHDTKWTIIFITMVGISLIDLIFMIRMVNGLYQKNVKAIVISYYYILSTAAIFVCGLITLSIYLNLRKSEDRSGGIILLIFGSIYVCLNICISVTAQKKIKKMHDDALDRLPPFKTIMQRNPKAPNTIEKIDCV